MVEFGALSPDIHSLCMLHLSMTGGFRYNLKLRAILWWEFCCVPDDESLVLWEEKGGIWSHNANLVDSIVAEEGGN